jgi:uncharacterized membrane protein YfcA
VIDLPAAATFAAVVHDPRFIAAVVIAGLSGLVRGFSGFGSALIYVPLMSALYDPKIAAPTFIIADLVTGVMFLAGIWRKADYREVLPMAAVSLIAVQFGALVLQYADPIALRWALCGLVAGVVVVLASGWRYHGKPALSVSIGVGIVAGLIGGAVQIAGPPIIVYWLGGGFPPDVLRANFFAYFSLFSAGTVITYAFRGLLTPEVLALSCFVTPLTIAGMWIGSQLFGLATEKTYRRIAFMVAAVSAVIAMPIFDRFLH